MTGRSQPSSSREAVRVTRARPGPPCLADGYPGVRPSAEIGPCRALDIRTPSIGRSKPEKQSQRPVAPETDETEVPRDHARPGFSALAQMAPFLREHFRAAMQACLSIPLA